MHILGMSIFELGMLLSFGAAWPVSLYKSFKFKSAKGKTLLFPCIVAFGYICGIINKILNAPGDIVIYFYLLNLVMVSGEIAMYFVNSARDKKRDAEAAANAVTVVNS